MFTRAYLRPEFHTAASCHPNLAPSQLPATRHLTTLFNKYKNYRNKLTAILRAAEKGYYANKLHQHRTNLRKVWRTINEIVGKSVYTPKITEIDHNGSETSDAKVIAET